MTTFSFQTPAAAGRIVLDVKLTSHGSPGNGYDCDGDPPEWEIETGWIESVLHHLERPLRDDEIEALCADEKMFDKIHLAACEAAYDASSEPDGDFEP